MHPLAQKIATLQRGLVLRERAAAMCCAAATVLAAAPALGTADYFIRFADPGLRIMATVALLAVIVWASYRWWYLPCQGRLKPLTVARKIETRFPQLKDSLSSAVEFLDQSENDATAGSELLRRIVVSEAQTAVDSLPVEEVVDRCPLRRAATWLALPALIAILRLALNASAVGTALVRLVAPLGSTQWPRVNHLEFRELPTKLAVGQTFEVELIDKFDQLPEDVRIEYRIDHDGRRELITENMTPAGDAMIARRENVRDSFSFRAEGGDDRIMPWHHVVVADPPQLESMNITIHPPAYTGIPPAPAERHMEVLAGTTIELAGASNHPLASARVLLDDGESIAADIGTAAGATSQSAATQSTFYIPPDRWVAEKTSAYRIEFIDTFGLAGIGGPWNLRVDPDSPPSVSWQGLGGDVYVTPSAIVPFAVTVKDNLAIQQVALTYDRTDRSEADRVHEPNVSRIDIYLGPEHAETVEGGRTKTDGGSRVFEYAWDLSPLTLADGAQLTVNAEATDYRPGTGRTAAPRRITIITAEQLEARLADRQTQIVRQLERALELQRATREEVRRLEIQQRDASALGPGDRNSLQSAELNQRRIRDNLTSPTDGVPALANSLLAESKMNHVEDSETVQQMHDLLTALERLAAGPLGIADQELLAARNDLATAANPLAISDSLTNAGKAQDEVISEVEQLITTLSGAADARRIARQLAALREAQLAHASTTRAEISIESLPLERNELTRNQRAALNKAAAGEEAIAARFEKIQQAMDQLAKSLAESEDNSAAIVSDAADLARRLAISTNIFEATRDLEENHVGRAQEREKQIADDLQQVLDVLRNRSSNRLEQSVKNLRDAEQQLAALREQLAALKQQLAQVEQRGNSPANSSQQAELNRKQKQLKQSIEQLTRQLDRLQAKDAAKSTKSAANCLGSRPPSGNQNDPNSKSASPSSQAQQAEKDLEKAAQQLAAQRQQAEEDLALEFVRRFQRELNEMVERQQAVLKDTLALDSVRRPAGTLTDEQLKVVARLSQEERELAELAKEHSELLFGLGAVRLSLEDAERRLNIASMLLAARDTGAASQAAETLALARLEEMRQAFAQTAAEAGANKGGSAAGAGAGESQPKRPTFELLEVKMLRSLQIDLNRRTLNHQERLSAVGPNSTNQQQAAFDREARALSAEQGRLAELVQEMLSRDNDNAEGETQ